MTNTILIQGGTVIGPESTFIGDVEIAGETIRALGVGLPAREPCTAIDARGCFVLPGLVDPHTHIALDTGVYRTADDWEIGTRAAACGGVTTVIDFATQLKGQSLRQAVEARLAEAEGKACIDYGLHVMVTDFPLPLGEGKGEGLGALRELGTPSVKLYTTYRPNYYADDDAILRVLRASSEARVLVMVHCENDALVTAATGQLAASGNTSWRYHPQGRPALAEQEAVHRVLFLAKSASASVYIVHCSTGRSVELVRDARERCHAASVTYEADDRRLALAETCPQYLLLDEACYQGDHPERYILQPPLRAAGESETLWRLVAAGAVATVGTDHCDYTLAQKTAVNDFTRTPGGLPGLETLLPLLYTYGVARGRLSWPQLVRLCSTNPARIFGLGTRKGNLLPGAEADVVIYDPRGESTIQASRLHTIAGYNPYEGWRVEGRVRTTISRGRVVYRRDKFIGNPGHGRFVPGAPFDPQRAELRNSTPCPLPQ
jgi:dihydropyrimidinase